MRLIDADALKKKFGYTDEWYKSRSVTQEVDNALTVERPQGEWIFDEKHSITIPFYKCTNCNHFGGNNTYRYCPICGAEMQVKDELNNELKEINNEHNKRGLH